MENYISLLFEEFKRTQGMNNTEKFGNHKKEFNDWIAIQQTIKNSYAKTLTNMDLKEGLIAELGKGCYDSIVPNLNSLHIPAIAITPFASTFENGNLTALNGEIVLSDGSAIICYKDRAKTFDYPNCNQLINSNISTLITQLPYNMVDLKALVESSRQYTDVAIGSYGNVNDKNAHYKVKVLRVIKDIIESQYYAKCYEELIEQNGTYNHIILSHQKELTLDKSLTRSR